MNLPNNDFRNEIKKSGVRGWQIADHMGIREETLSRKLRHVTDEDKSIIRKAIEEIKQKGQ